MKEVADKLGLASLRYLLSLLNSLKKLLMNFTYHQVVLNQISASTYGKIGKSADESKYVMGGRGQEVEGKPTWTNELEVEFREEEMGEVIRGKRTEDFEVEFSSAAPGPRLQLGLYHFWIVSLEFCPAGPE